MLVPIAAGLVAGSAHRQLARSLGCAPSTVTRLSARLGRHALLLHALVLELLAGRLAEPVAVDHFETFEFTRDWPFGVLTLVGRDSWFVLGLDPAPHARTGRITALQDARLKTRPSRPRRGGYRGSFLRGLDLLVLLTPEQRRMTMGRDRALYPVDQLHALVRHTRADHRRETIAFGRRLNAIMERLFLLVAWRNFIKGRSERRPDPTTPAMRLGLADTPWTWRRLLARRLFIGHASLPHVWRDLYRRAWPTPAFRSNRRHDLRHAT